MAQYPPSISIENASPLQEQINLQSAGNYVTVGAPGGPVIFATFGRYIITALANSPARTIAKPPV